jgi:signal transduction histidine kinase
VVRVDRGLEFAPAAAELKALAEEQAALRRVATLVARGQPPRTVFATVAEEVGRPLGADLTLIGRYEAGAMVTGVAGWQRTGDPVVPGVRVKVGGRNVTTLVYETRAPARIDSYADASGAAADDARARGIASAVGAPIAVEGRVWGVMLVARTDGHALPPGTEARLVGFTELLATAIANAEAREALRRVADEQAALRRVATLVAQGVAPTEVFAAVTREVGALLGADATIVMRLDPDGAGTVVAHVGGHPEDMSVGTRWKLEPPLAIASVLRTGCSARLDGYEGVPGEFADVIRRMGIQSSVACPIVVAGRLWGAIGVGARHERFPPDTERRMADFTELVATAVANAEAHAELRASRARIVATADETRRRIERDLHDGAQQQLVSLALELRRAQATVPAELEELARELDHVVHGLAGAVDELREMARGIHPAILSEGGLAPALATLARRAAVPVALDVRTSVRLPDAVEATVYYVVSEALTNAARHANASVVGVAVEVRDGILGLVVSDDGVGGADPMRGSGLVGLKDRVEATGGTLSVSSRAGEGTQLIVELPIDSAASIRPSEAE